MTAMPFDDCRFAFGKAREPSTPELRAELPTAAIIISAFLVCERTKDAFCASRQQQRATFLPFFAGGAFPQQQHFMALCARSFLPYPYLRVPLPPLFH